MHSTSPRIVALLLILFLATPAFSKEERKETAREKAERLWGNGHHKTVSLSLKECLGRATTLNRQLEVADYDIKTAEEKENEVRKIGFPVLEYEYNVGPAPKDVSHAIDSFFSGDLTVFNKLKVGLGVPLQTFGKVGTGKQLADLGIQVEKEKKEAKKKEIALRVHELYNGILLAREIRRLLDTAARELGKEIEKREEKGGGDPSALLKLKLFHAELERRLEEVDKKEIMAKEALRILVDVDPTIGFDIRSDRLYRTEATLASFEKYQGEALDQRDDLQQLDIAYQAREKKLFLERRLTTPNLGLGAFFEMGRTPNVTGITTTDDFSDPLNFTRAGVGLRLSGQFDFHGTAAKIRQAKSELKKTEIQRDLARDGIVLELKEAYLNVRNASQEIERTEEAGKLSRQLLFLTQSNYDIGLAEPKDFVDAIQSFLETRGKYFEAVFNYNVAVARLSQKTGKEAS